MDSIKNLPKKDDRGNFAAKILKTRGGEAEKQNKWSRRVARK